MLAEVCAGDSYEQRKGPDHFREKCNIGERSGTKTEQVEECSHFVP